MKCIDGVFWAASWFIVIKLGRLNKRREEESREAESICLRAVRSDPDLSRPLFRFVGDVYGDDV